MCRIKLIIILTLINVNLQGFASTLVEKPTRVSTMSMQLQIEHDDTIYLDPYLNHKICLVKQGSNEFHLIDETSGEILIDEVESPIAWGLIDSGNEGWKIDSLNIQVNTLIKYGFNPKYLTFKRKRKYVLYNIEKDTTLFVSKNSFTLKNTGSQQNALGRKYLPVQSPSWGENFISIYLKLPFWKKGIDTLYTYSYNSSYYKISKVISMRNNKLKKGIHYFDNKYQKGNYKNNKKSGVWKTYSIDNNELIAYHTYNKGKLDGSFKEWVKWDYLTTTEESDTIFREGFYKVQDSSFIGEWSCYPKNLKIRGSNITKLAVKENTSGFSFKVFIDNEILFIRGASLHLKKNRPIMNGITDYFLPEEIDGKGFIGDPDLNGKVEFYDTLGNIKTIKHYTRGELDGTFKDFDEKGRLTHQKVYSDGLKNGLEIKYNYALGNETIDTAFYSNDTLDGKYVSHYINGLLRERGVYKNGIRDSIWQFYSPFGGIDKEVNYSNNKANDYQFRLFLPPNENDINDHIVSPNGKFLFTKSNNLSLYDIQRKKWLSQNLIAGDLRFKVLDERKRGHGLTFYTLNKLSNDGFKVYDTSTELDLRTGKKADTLSKEAVYLSNNPKYFDHLKKEHRLGETNEQDVDYSKDTVTIRENSYCLLESNLWIWETIRKNIKSDESSKSYLLIHKLKKYDLSDSTVYYFPEAKLELVDKDCENIIAESFGNSKHLNLVIFNNCNYSEIKIFSFKEGAEKFQEHEAFSRKSVSYNNLAMLNNNEYLYNLNVYALDTDSLIKPFFDHFTENISSIFLSGKDSLVLLKNQSLDSAMMIDLSRNNATSITKNQLLGLDYFNDFQSNKKNSQINFLDIYGYKGYEYNQPNKVKYYTDLYYYDEKVADWYQKVMYFGNFAGHKNKYTLALRSHNNNKHLLQVSGSPGIFHVNEGKKKEIEKYIAIYLVNNLGYIFSAPDGYYLANGNNARHLSFGKNWESYPFEQFDLKYNRPDIILDRLGYADSSLIAAYHAAYKKRLKKMGFTEDMLKDDFHLPEIEIENFEKMPTIIDEGNIDLNLRMKDSKYKLDRINVWVNDVAIHGTDGISLRDQDVQKLNKTINVELAKGQNKVQVSVLNQAGAESFKETFELECSVGKKKPDLYLITIGESEFEQDDFNLTYAAKDARDIASLFPKSKVYDEVFTKTLTNDQVTRENVVGLKSFLEKADINDHVMVFLAGHGVLSANLDYYLATYDMDFTAPEKRGLMYEDLEGLLDGIKPLKKTLILDACHSGEIDKEEVELASTENTFKGDVQFRSVGKSVKSKLGAQNTLELTKSLFTDLRKGTGATVISSAGGMEFAMEGDDWNNGLFTYALLNGIESGEADLNGDKEIWLSELKEYVGLKVMELSNGKQQPTSRIENQTVDFRVW